MYCKWCIGLTFITSGPIGSNIKTRLSLLTWFSSLFHGPYSGQRQENHDTHKTENKQIKKDTISTAHPHCRQVLDNWKPAWHCVQKKQTKCHSHCAQLLASLQQHPLILVLPDSVVGLDLSSKEKVFLCILVTWGTASQQTENNYTQTHSSIGNIPKHSWKAPLCVFLHKCGYNTTHQITKTEKSFLPGHKRVSSLRAETVSSDDSMVVALPSNILPDNKSSLELLKSKHFRKYCRYPL